jgi:2-polyprenyl-3-methyl-5-hydroxy-6-metoxy-1,4-benzoquinol methylase
MDHVNPRKIRTIAKQLYATAPLLPRLLQTFRPAICPFEPLIAAVGTDASVLDIGCGSGLFLLLLTQFGRLKKGHGFDANRRAISVAKAVTSRCGLSSTIHFDYLDVQERRPEGEYDVVSMIDVLHHVPLAQQKAMIEYALERVRLGGTFVYKDMVSQPRWRALANALHDLVLARQVVHYRALGDVVSWVRGAGFSVAKTGRRNMFWYGHEWIIATR